MGLNEKQREAVQKLQGKGMSFDKAVEKVMNDGAVQAVKGSLERSKMTKVEANLRSEKLKQATDRRLKIALEKKAKREHLEKLSKKSLEELGKVKVEKEK